jgi:hypothetical protein
VPSATPSSPLAIMVALVEYIHGDLIYYFSIFSEIMLMCLLLPSMIENCSIAC